MDFLVDCRSLKKSYGRRPVLHDFSLQLERGRIIGLLGPNGSGKTTFIKILAGILSKNSGEIKISGRQIGIESKKIVSYLPERTYFSPSMKVKDTIKFFEDFYKDFKRERAEQMLSGLDISLNSKIKELSKGTREKVQLVLVMSREAELYLLDEPMGGVDPAARDYILKTILTNYNENASVIISTHLISDVEKVLDDVVFIKEGNVVLHQSVDEIRRENGMSVDALFREVQGAMYLGIYLIALLFSVIAVASDKINQALNGNPVFSVMRVLSLAAAVIALIAIFIITVVMCIIRYRNNLLKDEGYLMHTLPVSAASLHFSKLLAGIIWFIGDIAVLMISVGILTEDFRFTWIKSFKVILEQSGLKIDSGMAFVFVLYIVLSVISSLSMFYACLNLGSLSYSSKGIMGFRHRQIWRRQALLWELL